MLCIRILVAFGSRIVTIPLYATSSEAQVHYILQDAGIRFLFVGEQYQYDVACRVQNLCKTLKQIIIFDPKVKRSASDTNSIYYSDFLKLGMERKFQAEVDKRTSESGNGDLVNIFILLEQQESRRESCCIIRVMKLLLRHMMVG